MDNVKEYKPGTSIGDRLAAVQRIKLEIDALNDQLDDHKAFLLGHAIRNKITGFRFGALSLALRDKSNWIYSPAIKSAESKLKDRKTAEQNNGIAACNVTQHLVINFSARIALQSKVEA